MHTTKVITQYVDFLVKGTIEDRYEYSEEDFADQFPSWTKAEREYLQILVQADRTRPANMTGGQELAYMVADTMKSDESGDACPFEFMSVMVPSLDPKLCPDADTLKLAYLIWANGPDLLPK